MPVGSRDTFFRDAHAMAHLSGARAGAAAVPRPGLRQGVGVDGNSEMGEMPRVPSWVTSEGAPPQVCAPPLAPAPLLFLLFLPFHPPVFAPHTFSPSPSPLSTVSRNLSLSFSFSSPLPLFLSLSLSFSLSFFPFLSPVPTVSFEVSY